MNILKIDVVVCYSTLEICFDLYEPFSPNNDGQKILAEIHRRRLVLSENLENYYSNYFESNRPDLLDSYHQFIENCILYEDNSRFVNNSKADSRLSKIFDNEFYIELCRVACLTDDKIILSQLGEVLESACFIGITILSTIDILDESKENLLNNYRLPIIGKRIGAGESCESLSEWFSRFLKTESEFEIIDGYIYQNRFNFYLYFLRHIPRGSKIRISTLEDIDNRLMAVTIKAAFTNPPFNSWKIEISIIPNKKEQHARNIITNKYFIVIDKGMRIFGNGRDHQTEQSDIHIQYKNKITSISIPASPAAIQV